MRASNQFSICGTETEQECYTLVAGAVAVASGGDGGAVGGGGDGGGGNDE